ncbi:unnamed protein product [Allacma fusca]|uniref:Uncharacterized protein n=1 Tax=Allacma fusca TaxID=39272 RepID=A0A8J2L711_9HEXA|nr:unnamed protein product [Allacma fusca]
MLSIRRVNHIELLCNPVSAQHFRNIFKKSLTEKLWECLSGDENRELSDQCDIEIEWEGDQHRFQDLGRSNKFLGTYCRFGGSVMHSNQKTTYLRETYERH